MNRTKRPFFWQSRDELEQSAEFRELVEREFPTPLEVIPPSSPERRRFMQVMGASIALAGVTGCRWREDKLVPMTKRPEDVIPGESRMYATSMELGGWATGLYAKSYEGRPIKIEGNPQHPASRGSCNAFHQASLLGLYDPDRSHGVSRWATGKRESGTWKEFEKFAAEHFGGLRASGGAGLRVLSEVSHSLAYLDMKRRFMAAFPQARWVEYDPGLSDNDRAGSQLAFGRPYRTHLELDKAALVLSLDADVIAPGHPNDVANARAFADRRMPEGAEMSRVYAVESGWTLTGSVADHRLAVRAEQVKAVAAAIDAALSAAARPLPEAGPPQARPAAAFLDEPKTKKFLDVLVKDLLANAGQGVVVVGAHQPPEVHALAHRLNALLGNTGTTVWYSAEEEPAPLRGLQALADLVKEMAAGQVGTLVMLGGNPVYAAPADVAFAEALAKVKTSVHLSLYEDETSRRASWHLPRAHFLETWGDGAAYDGTVSIAQPLIRPLWDGRSLLEVLAVLSGDATTQGLALVRRAHAGLSADPRVWRKVVHDGFTDAASAPRSAPALRPLAAISFSERELGPTPQNGQLELVIVPDPKVYDGRFANNAWLQELPEPFLKLAWQNAAVMSPRTAESLGLKDGTLVRLNTGGRSITLPAMILPGHADGSVRITLGYGRTAAGMVGGDSAKDVASVGTSAYAIRTTALAHFGGGLEVAAVGDYGRLPCSQDTHTMDAIGQQGADARIGQIVREGTLEEYQKEPTFAQHEVHHPALLNLWHEPVGYDGHRWGMSIDMNRCIGCNACVTACQAENNIPVVGGEQLAKGREMLWLRVDRYFSGAPEEAELRFQPMPCQQCENAPCEQVCPVGATMHSLEGLNDMVYNRCIGTRYCSNNCPYKVRRFNFFNYNLDTIGITPWTPPKEEAPKVKSMMFNPEVTVRSRGVMEKCTYCVQRIQNVKIKAKNAKRAIEDGEIKTACQQTCPTDAIVFGDLNDKASRVKKLQGLPRSYGVLEELNNRPRTRYLARIRNPHPELG